MNAVHTKFLDLLRDQSQTDDSTKITVPELCQEMNEDMKIKFRRSLSVNLFGWDDLLSLRMKLSLGDFAWVRKKRYAYIYRFKLTLPLSIEIGQQ